MVEKNKVIKEAELKKERREKRETTDQKEGSTKLKNDKIKKLAAARFFQFFLSFGLPVATPFPMH